MWLVTYSALWCYLLECYLPWCIVSQCHLLLRYLSADHFSWCNFWLFLTGCRMPILRSDCCCLRLEAESSADGHVFPADTRPWANVGSRLGQRDTRWTKLEPTLAQGRVFAGNCSYLLVLQAMLKCLAALAATVVAEVALLCGCCLVFVTSVGLTFSWCCCICRIWVQGQLLHHIPGLPAPVASCFVIKPLLAADLALFLADHTPDSSLHQINVINT